MNIVVFVSNLNENILRSIHFFVFWRYNILKFQDIIRQLVNPADLSALDLLTTYSFN